MPMRAKRPCKWKGCPELTGSGPYCAEHGVQADKERGARQQDQDDRRGSAASRGYGHWWRKLRRMQLSREPVCQVESCGQLATDVDHIVPKREGGRDTLSNLQSLCHSHHSQKTRREKLKPTTPCTVVAGPPGSGKTHYVHTHRLPGDLVLDLDALFSALSGLPLYRRPAPLLPFVCEVRDALLERLSRRSDLRHAWVITSDPKPPTLHGLASRLAARLVVLEVPAEECLRRIEADEQREGSRVDWKSLVDAWWREREEAAAGPPGDSV